MQLVCFSILSGRHPIRFGSYRNGGKGLHSSVIQTDLSEDSFEASLVRGGLLGVSRLWSHQLGYPRFVLSGRLSVSPLK